MATFTNDEYEKLNSELVTPTNRKMRQNLNKDNILNFI